jgi:hypothetical protein
MWSQAVSTLISAFRVKTSNNVITIQAYSDYNFSSQIGSDLTYAADNPTKTKRFGLAISPSSYGQGSTINKISIDRN